MKEEVNGILFVIEEEVILEVGEFVEDGFDDVMFVVVWEVCLDDVVMFLFIVVEVMLLLVIDCVFFVFCWWISFLICCRVLVLFFWIVV